MPCLRSSILGSQNAEDLTELVVVFHTGCTFDAAVEVKVAGTRLDDGFEHISRREAAGENPVGLGVRLLKLGKARPISGLASAAELILFKGVNEDGIGKWERGLGEGFFRWDPGR
jgi:hypothetical protein